jgi:ABC-type glycerol-3-phosphate transport system permease component
MAVRERDRPFGKMVETQRAMVRTLCSRVLTLLLDVVAGWACAWFFFYGVQSAMNALTILTAAVGAVAVATAVFLILELSNRYVGQRPSDHCAKG